MYLYIVLDRSCQNLSIVLLHRMWMTEHDLLWLISSWKFNSVTCSRLGTQAIWRLKTETRCNLPAMHTCSSPSIVYSYMYINLVQECLRKFSLETGHDYICVVVWLVWVWVVNAVWQHTCSPFSSDCPLLWLVMQALVWLVARWQLYSLSTVPLDRKTKLAGSLRV